MARGKRGGQVESADTVQVDLAAADTVAAVETDTPASADTPGAVPNEELPAGERIGRYVIIGPLGRGGMGTVYKAFDPELDRAIALKVVNLREGNSTADERLRLAREAQAIARVSHPNVVAVHDVGVEGNAVFVAMEFVDGSTLREWTRRRTHSWREVAAMYLQAGRGLAAAHAAGLVHRDFKPENVLVGHDGRARVVDFGLARAAGDVIRPITPVPRSEGSFDPEMTGPLSTPITRAGAIMGTPGYMAPEQYIGGAADEQTDQYSFCIALFEALYGERPFTGKTVNEIKQKVLDGVLPEEPRGTGVPRKVRDLITRGLEVDRAERHPTMDHLLAGLEATMARRTRGKVAAAVLAAALVAGSVAAVASRHEAVSPCQGGARKLAGVWDGDVRRAVGAALAEDGARVETRRRVESDLDRYSRAWVQRHQHVCEATRVHGEQSERALDLRMACLDRQLAEVREVTSVLSSGDPALAARAAIATGRLPDLADCDDVRALDAVAPPPADPEVRRAIEELEARLGRVRALSDAGNPAAAKEVADAALAEAEQLGYGPTLARARFTRATLHRLEQDATRARELLFAALVAGERSGDDVVRAQAAIDLVFTVGYLGNDAERGLAYGELAQAILVRLGGRESLEALLTSNIGTIHHSQQRYEEGVALFERSLALRERLYGRDSFELVSPLNNLGSALNVLGRNDEAVRHLERAAHIIESLFGPDHPHRAAVLVNLGLARYDLVQHEQAIAHYQEAIRIYEGQFGADHPLLAAPLNNQADALADLGRFEESFATYGRALKIRETAYGERPPLALTLVGYGAALRQAARYDDSAAMIARARDIWLEAHGEEHPDVARALHHLGLTRALQGRAEEGRRLLERAIAIQEASAGADNVALVSMLAGLGRIQLMHGQLADAVPVLERALTLAEAKGSPPHATAEIQLALAMALWSAPAERPRARALAERAQATFAALGPLAKAQLAESQAWLKSR